MSRAGDEPIGSVMRLLNQVTPGEADTLQPRVSRILRCGPRADLPSPPETGISPGLATAGAVPTRRHLIHFPANHAHSREIAPMDEPFQLPLFPDRASLARIRPAGDESRFCRLEVWPDLFGRALLLAPHWGRIGSAAHDDGRRGVVTNSPPRLRALLALREPVWVSCMPLVVNRAPVLTLWAAVVAERSAIHSRQL
jgi:hypothetical protein